MKSSFQNTTGEFTPEQLSKWELFTDQCSAQLISISETSLVISVNKGEWQKVSSGSFILRRPQKFYHYFSKTKLDSIEIDYEKVVGIKESGLLKLSLDIQNYQKARSFIFLYSSDNSIRKDMQIKLMGEKAQDILNLGQLSFFNELLSSKKILPNLPSLFLNEYGREYISGASFYNHSEELINGSGSLIKKTQQTQRMLSTCKEIKRGLFIHNHLCFQIPDGYFIIHFNQINIQSTISRQALRTIQFILNYNPSKEEGHSSLNFNNVDITKLSSILIFDFSKSEHNHTLPKKIINLSSSTTRETQEKLIQMIKKEGLYQYLFLSKQDPHSMRRNNEINLELYELLLKIPWFRHEV